MRSMHGAEIFCPIRSYLATTARHGISWLDALTRAASGTPWIPQNRINQPGTKAPPTKAITGTYLVTSELRPIRRSASACLLNSVVVVDPVLPIIGRRSASSYALCGGRSGASSLRKIPLRHASSQNTRSTWKTQKKASARQEHDQHLGHGRLVPSKMLCLDLHGISTPI